jgi:hypothetical protein
MKLGTPADSTNAARCNGRDFGTSRRRSTGRLQQLREDAEGVRADVFALGPLLLGPLRRSQIERGGFHRARKQGRCAQKPLGEPAYRAKQRMCVQHQGPAVLDMKGQL